MRRVLITLMAIAAVGAGAAFAQGMGSQYWAGISTGAPGTAVHFGVRDVAPNLSVRANVGYGYVGNFSGITAGVDGLYNLPVGMSSPVSVYVGLGPMIASNYKYNGKDNFAFGGNVFVGAEYGLSSIGFAPGSVYLEVGPNFLVADSTFIPNIYAQVGFNYTFGQ